MAQHFLTSSAARTLSLADIARMSDEEAETAFRKIRWPDTDGEPSCPYCGRTDPYWLKGRKVWRCRDKDCARQYSVTSGTLFSSRKLPLRTYLFAIAIFVNSVKGRNALQLGRDLGVQYKTAYVIAHKLREAMGSDQFACEPDCRFAKARKDIHHNVSDKNLSKYEDEMRWRTFNRRESNGEQYLMVAGAAANLPASREWTGYWQKSKKKSYRRNNV